jgi:predicted metal-dependent hydrolase
MLGSSTVEIDGIGQVLFERSARAKHLNISVRPYLGVRVAVPHGISFKNARRSVESRIGWIQKHLDKMRQVEAKNDAMTRRSARINKAEARKKLVGRLNQLSERHGLGYNKVFIRNQKTRWGSCSAKNNISLNMKLLRLPKELVDYVILHELVHTRVKNHGKRFWAVLDTLVGDAKTLRSKLNGYEMALWN